MKAINPFGYSHSPIKVVEDLKRVSGVSIDSTTLNVRKPLRDHPASYRDEKR